MGRAGVLSGRPSTMKHGEVSDRVECLASRIANFLTEENAKIAKGLEEEFTFPSTHSFITSMCSLTSGS